jgi:hypothetical protein
VQPAPGPTSVPPATAPPPPPPAPNTPASFNAPPPPNLPALPPLPPQQPLAPPAPPAPPASGAANLTLFTSPPVLSVAPSIALFPPAPPVINVAPPTPARPVERAKKAAHQSSGSGSGVSSEGADPTEAHGRSSLVQDQHEAATRLEPDRNRHAFTAHRPDQVSAWARDLQWGGGLTLMSLVLAFGWITVRPTPRRRQPQVPAPGWARER